MILELISALFNLKLAKLNLKLARATYQNLLLNWFVIN